MIDKELLKLIDGNKRYIFYTVVVMTVGMLASVSITAAICWAIYLLTQGAKVILFLYPAVIVGVAVVFRFICTRLTGHFREIIGYKVKKSLRERTYNKILKLGVKGDSGMSMAGLTQISIEGIEQLDLYYSVYLPQFFFAMIAPVILFAICVGLDWRMSVVLIACVPLIPISIVFVSKYAKKVFMKYWGKYTSMGDVFLDSIQGLKELKIFKADHARHIKINQSAEEFRKITMKVLVMQLSSITIMDLVAFGGAGVGIALAILGASGGTVIPITALFLVLVAVEFFLPLRSLGGAFHVAMNGASAGSKIVALLNIPDPVWGECDVTETDIALSGVTFSYDGVRDAVKDVSMVFPSKGMTAIVGESGCGKSTIVNLIIGARQAACGEVTVGGQAIDTLSAKSYFSRLAVVSYNTYIFNQTVRENFYLANPDCSDEEILNALRMVNLHEFTEHNGGLDKPITEDANNISGGEKQRLALAVNLVTGKDIYIFDEATSNIDIESEAIIMKNIRSLSEKASVIVISHRLANVVSADKIYYMQNSEVKESGSHKELMKLNGGYTKLFSEQRRLEEGYKKSMAQSEVVA